MFTFKNHCETTNERRNETETSLQSRKFVVSDDYSQICGLTCFFYRREKNKELRVL